MGEYQHITHGFDPVFDERSRVLVLGSFPSVLSRENAFYYGNPQNRFWRVIAACVGVPVPPNEGDALPGGIPASLAASIEAKRELLLGHGIALWDVIESCDIKGSSDASIKNVVPARIERIVGSAHIGVVFCNGGTAGRLYRRTCKIGPEFRQWCCLRPARRTRRGVSSAWWSGGPKRSTSLPAGGSAANRCSPARTIRRRPITGRK